MPRLNGGISPHWIEEAPGPEFTNALLVSMLVVDEGKMPSDFGLLTRSAPEGWDPKKF